MIKLPRPIREKFLLGLYLYVRKIQLSIDRGIGDEWAKLVQYFDSDSSSYLAILAEFEKYLADINFRSSNYEGQIIRPTASWWWVFVDKKNSLFENEIKYIYECVNLFSEYLRQKQPPSHQDIISLRMYMVDIENLIHSRLGKLGRSVKYVEHYNQNPTLKCKSIDEIISQRWPEN